MSGQRPGLLASKGNRIGLGVLAGFVAQILVGLADAGFFPRILVWALVAWAVYAITTRSQAGKDSSR